MPNKMNVPISGGKTYSISLPSNDPAIINKQKEESERPKLKKVVQATPTRKKQSLISKISDSLFMNLSFKDIASQIFKNTILPSIKNAVYYTIINTASLSLFNKMADVTKGNIVRSNGVLYTSYNDISKQVVRQQESSYAQYSQNMSSASRDANQIVFETRLDAERVVRALMDQIDEYGYATISNYYDLIGLPAEFSDEYWGWNDLGSAQVISTANGYSIRLPKLKDVKNFH